MHILYLAEINNPHVQRWVKYFTEQGHRISLLCDYKGPKPHPDVTVIHPQMNFLTKVVAFKLFHR